MLLFINLLSLTEQSTIVPEKSRPPPQAHLYDRTLEDTRRRRRAYTYQHQSGKLDTLIRPRTGKFDFIAFILVQGLCKCARLFFAIIYCILCNMYRSLIAFTFRQEVLVGASNLGNDYEHCCKLEDVDFLIIVMTFCQLIVHTYPVT